MMADKRFFSLISILLPVLPVLGISIFYFVNPLINKCIQGNCENGRGIYVSASGMKYEGEWKNGKRDGRGILTYSDGSRYTGDWKNGRMHGQGIKIYSSDDLYREFDGEWRNGNRHGKGTMIYAGGERYTGDWRNGRINGHGTYTAHDGRTIEGEWENEILNGQVTEKFPDGRILVAEWVDGRKQGHGIMTYPDGRVISQEWINGRLAGSADFYLFRYSEFQKDYTIAALCDAIKKNIHLSTEAKEDTLEWLNSILRIPDLYEKLNEKINNRRLSDEIEALVNNSTDFRNRKYSELNNDRQKSILKLNRLLLEYLYPGQAPKT